MSKKDDEHVVDEVVEHIILEKKELLKGHHSHFLPKEKKPKAKGQGMSNTTFVIVVLIELALLYKIWIA